MCDLLLVLCESFIHDLTDAGIETLQLLILRRHVRCGGLRREDTHEAGEEAVDRADDLRVGARHARGDATLERLEAQQDHLLSLSTRMSSMKFV